MVKRISVQEKSEVLVLEVKGLARNDPCRRSRPVAGFSGLFMLDSLLLIASLLAAFAYSGLEAAVYAVSRVRVVHAAREGDRRARQLLRQLEDRDALVACMTLCSHVSAVLAFALLARAWLPPRDALAGLALLACVAASVLLLELLPKKLFRRFPFRLLRALWPLLALGGLLRPWFRSGHLQGPMPKAEGSQSAPPKEAGYAEELRLAARGLSQRGQLSAATSRLLDRALDFAPLAVSAVMQPLNQAHALGSEMPIHTAMTILRRSGQAALPVLDGAGRWVGFLEIGQLGGTVPRDRLVRQHARGLDRVQPHDSASSALRLLRRRAKPLALVVDHEGKACGLLHHDELLRRLLVAQPVSQGS